MTRWLRLWLLRRQINRVAADLNWKSQHRFTLENEILAIRADIARGDKWIEERHAQLRLLQSEIWSLESPGGIINSAIRRAAWNGRESQ